MQLTTKTSSLTGPVAGLGIHAGGCSRAQCRACGTFLSSSKFYGQGHCKTPFLSLPCTILGPSPERRRIRHCLQGSARRSGKTRASVNGSPMTTHGCFLQEPRPLPASLRRPLGVQQLLPPVPKVPWLLGSRGFGVPETRLPLPPHC